MYQLSQGIVVPSGSASYSANNLSAFYLEPEQMAFACFIHKNEVNTISWNSKMEGFASGTVPIVSDCEQKLIVVLQAKYCAPVCRSFPVLVIASSIGVMICDLKTNKVVAHAECSADGRKGIEQFARGITHVVNTIAVGTHSGKILLFNCSGDNSVRLKNSIQEQKDAIADMASCQMDELSCACDVAGNVVVWTKNFKTVLIKFSTGLSINCINVLMKQVILATFNGQLLFYSIADGQLMAEVNAHVRQINAVVVAPKSGLVMSVSEDTVIRVWKLRIEAPNTYEVEWQFGERVTNMPLVGAQFLDECGSMLLVTAYDHAKILSYQRIQPKPNAEGNESKNSNE